MSLVLRHALQRICVESGWDYAVSWRLQFRTKKVLTWEDGFCKSAGEPDENQNFCGKMSVDYHRLTSIVAKMSYHMHTFAEGIVGRVAFTGGHHWTFSPYSSGMPMDASMHDMTMGMRGGKYPDGWEEQFLAGIKSIVVIGVPGGVVQLGSGYHEFEDTSFIAGVQALFASLEAIPGAFPSDSLVAGLESSAAAGLTNSFLSSHQHHQQQQQQMLWQQQRQLSDFSLQSFLQPVASPLHHHPFSMGSHGLSMASFRSTAAIAAAGATVQQLGALDRSLSAAAYLSQAADSLNQPLRHTPSASVDSEQPFPIPEPHPFFRRCKPVPDKAAVSAKVEQFRSKGKGIATQAADLGAKFGGMEASRLAEHMLQQKVQQSDKKAASGGGRLRRASTSSILIPQIQLDFFKSNPLPWDYATAAKFADSQLMGSLDSSGSLPVKGNLKPVGDSDLPAPTPAVVHVNKTGAARKRRHAELAASQWPVSQASRLDGKAARQQLQTTATTADDVSQKPAASQKPPPTEVPAGKVVSGEGKASWSRNWLSFMPEADLKFDESDELAQALGFGMTGQKPQALGQPTILSSVRCFVAEGLGESSVSGGERVSSPQVGSSAGSAAAAAGEGSGALGGDARSDCRVSEVEAAATTGGAAGVAAGVVAGFAAGGMAGGVGGGVGEMEEAGQIGQPAGWGEMLSEADLLHELAALDAEHVEAMRPEEALNAGAGPGQQHASLMHGTGQRGSFGSGVPHGNGMPKIRKWGARDQPSPFAPLLTAGGEASFGGRHSGMVRSLATESSDLAADLDFFRRSAIAGSAAHDLDDMEQTAAMEASMRAAGILPSFSLSDISAPTAAAAGTADSAVAPFHALPPAAYARSILGRQQLMLRGSAGVGTHASLPDEANDVPHRRAQAYMTAKGGACLQAAAMIPGLAQQRLQSREAVRQLQNGAAVGCQLGSLERLGVMGQLEGIGLPLGQLLRLEDKKGAVGPGKGKRQQKEVAQVGQRKRPRDRQLIQDRLSDLRQIVPNVQKLSIDMMLEKTIRHFLFLEECVTQHLDVCDALMSQTQSTSGAEGAARPQPTAECDWGSMEPNSIAFDRLHPFPLLRILVKWAAPSCRLQSLSVIQTICQQLGISVLRSKLRAEDGQLLADVIVIASEETELLKANLASILASAFGEQGRKVSGVKIRSSPPIEPNARAGHLRCAV